ncbi:MAG: endonuclease/exonuclease/phosphatase family protein [Candidatus Hydrogenedentes bacterium]|nr:endonuclease/exonuclease/phosphatase family protein [Candidatus Hydrogenedentota bacterium]
MRLLIYNIRYGTGGKHFLLPWSGYLRRTGSNLRSIIEFIRSVDPDVMGLIEVDDGSFRTCRQNQAEQIARELGHYHTYRCKYAERSFAHRVPVINKQGNAFLSRDTIAGERFHYFTAGAKRLVIELELDNVIVFLVHLALGFRIRQHQLEELYQLVKNARKPAVVAGDFNVFWGDREINLFTAATGLVTANLAGMPSFPSWTPTRQLDFILHSPEVESRRFWMPAVTYSDHLPLVWDFNVRA